jgi:hypothetical protein
VAETTAKKDFYAAGFDALVKRWDNEDDFGAPSSAINK